jgi:hypothetical protein
MLDFHGIFRVLLHVANLHGTDGFTSPPKEGVLRIFSPLKIRRLRPGLNPRTWVLKASTLPLEHRRRSVTGLKDGLISNDSVGNILPESCGLSGPHIDSIFLRNSDQSTRLNGIKTIMIGTRIIRDVDSSDLTAYIEYQFK